MLNKKLHKKTKVLKPWKGCCYSALLKNDMKIKPKINKYNEKDWKKIAEQIKKQMRPLEKQNPAKEWSGEVICTFADMDKRKK